MHRLIYDCDNTMGVRGRDIDDGLALLYLLGRSDVHLEAITATFGNGDLDEVMEATGSLLQQLRMTRLPLLRGAASSSDRRSAAAEFMAERVEKRPGVISILATGSLTNLAGAAETHPGFFSRVREIVIMGGVTDPLLIGGRVMDELNLSCDPEAASMLFNAPCPLTVVTGNLCLQAELSQNRYRERFSRSSTGVFGFLEPFIAPWFRQMAMEFSLEGFHPWDVVAAVRLTNPELFSLRPANVKSTLDELRRGHLELETSRPAECGTDIPLRLLDPGGFWDLVFDAWERAPIPPG
jgi:inosine-uridine nucleoside N-ribohydrolase